jgi:uncharacterized Fe-S cluster-containing radical SAM superfamily protein
MTQKLIDTDDYSARLRAKAVHLTTRQLLITRFSGSEQEQDLSVPPNCAGLGRIRHFRRQTSPGWPANPLPIDPACQALGQTWTDALRAQAFQNAVCNWRCWYCYVPFDLLAANPKFSAWCTAEQLLSLYQQEPDPPAVIDLTGGQPDLVPEWVAWMMEAIQARGLEKQIYLWSDDNLSTDYFWRFLSTPQQELIATYRNYARVCCFKGFDAESFSFNTQAAPELYERQFVLLERLLATGIDIYAYTTFTSPEVSAIPEKMARFVDRLQRLDENLPLRTIPLEVKVFTPVNHRLDAKKMEALLHQQQAIEAWEYQLQCRYTAAQRTAAHENISQVRLSYRKGKHWP